MAHEMPRVEGVRHRFVPGRDGLRFHVAEAGEGEPLVLLHGWPQHWYMWRLLIPALAERHRVLAMDLRGFGWSDIAWEGFEKESMADDVIAVMERLDVPRAAIVGHDWGGWIGALLAMRRPDAVERLVMMSIPPPFAGPRLGALRAAPHLAYQLALASPAGVKLLSRPSYVASKIRRWAHRREHLRKEVQRLYGRDLRASTRARAASLLYRTFLLREVPALAAGRYRDQRIEVPTLMLQGDRDPVVRPVFYQGYESHFADLRLVVLKDTGHFPAEERPEQVTEHLLGFLQPAAAATPATPQPA